MRFLIDENLSPTLVQRLAEREHPAEHVAHSGLQGTSDPELWQHAFDNDLVVITVNASDFLRLAADVALHPGLIVLRSESVTREESWQWIEPVIRHIDEHALDLTNKVIEVHGIDDFELRDIPPP